MWKVLFTGALTDKTGAFVAANGGTIFLDEIGNFSYEVQIQLLRALQERKYVRSVLHKISGWYPSGIPPTRIWNRPLKKGLSVKTFIIVSMEFTLRMPDLKERKRISCCSNFFLDQANKELDWASDRFWLESLTSFYSIITGRATLRQMKNIKKSDFTGTRKFHPFLNWDRITGNKYRLFASMALRKRRNRERTHSGRHCAKPEITR